MNKAYVFILAATVLMVSILGCNALRGAGKDIEDSGEHIQNVGK